MRAVEVVTDVDPSEWGRFVLAHPNGSIFQTPDMYHVYSATKYHDPMVLAALSNGEIRGILLSCMSRYGSGVRGLLSNRSTIWGGPLVSDEDQEVARLLITAHDGFVRGKVLFSQVKNVSDPGPLLSTYESSGYTFQDHINYIVDLSPGEDRVFARFQKRKRNLIRGAIRDGLITRCGREKDVEIFYQMLKEVFLKARIPLQDFTFFRAIFDCLVPKGLARFFICESDGVPIAGLLCLMYHDTMYGFYAASFRQYVHLYPNEVMHWNVFQWAIQNEYKVFDFCGAGSPEEEWGVRDFKRRFGGREVNFGWFRKIESPLKMNLARAAFAVYRKLMR